MATYHELQSGWVGDIPDHRDLTPDHPRVTKALRLPGKGDGRLSLPAEVDLREYCPPVVDQAGFATSSAHASVSMVQYFERRANGRAITPSRLFVHHNALRLDGTSGGCRVSLRTALKAMTRFGVPPERYWPYEADRLIDTPDGFAYGFHRELRRCLYLRLDDINQTGEDTLRRVRSYLAAGFACVCGFPLPGTVSNSPDISFPVPRDDCGDGHAVLVVGYTDDRWIRSDKGALLLQNSWGEHRGDSGYGWLPYAYVRKRLAVDFWTLMRRSWLRTGEFTRPMF